MPMRDRLTDLADDALDRLERLQRWWREQSPHPALTQILIAACVCVVVLGAYSGDETEDAVLVTAMTFGCILFSWVMGAVAAFRTLGSLRPEGGAQADDDATRDIDPAALDARRRLRLWSGSLWWLHAPWLSVVVARIVLRAIALVTGSETGRVGLGCSQIPLWIVSVPIGLWIWQRHFRRASRSLGSRTESDLDARVFWCAFTSAMVNFVWAGLLII